MKRKREGMEKVSEIKSVIEQSSLLKIEGQIRTMPLLNICKLILQVLDKIGPTMAVLRQDMHQNIQRLEKLYQMNPSKYSNIVEIMKKEVEERSAKKVASCTNALLWLTRSMDFTMALLEKVGEDPLKTLPQAVEDSYENTLKPWHGWISSAAYKVALKLVPDKKIFISLLVAEEEKGDMLKEEIKSLVALLSPLLNEIHTVLSANGLDRLKTI